MPLTQPIKRPCRSLTDKIDRWEEELKHDPDKEFLLQGIRHGFHVCDTTRDPIPVDMDNYKSATNPRIRQKVEAQILDEIANGNYEVVNYKPKLISALGAIEKPNSEDIRLIHDCSQPTGGALNDYANLDYHVTYQTIDEAASLIGPNYYCAKVDLKSAYRSVAISPECHTFAGLKWRFRGQKDYTYIIDKKLMFGSKLSPGIFVRISSAVKRMLIRRGINAIVVYLDDFLLVAETKEACMEALNCLITLLRQLGFFISWAKVCGPSRQITFLGINIDTVRMMLELPPNKLADLMRLIDKFFTMRRASKKQLQSLAGKLNWSAQVVRGGRSYLRRILDLMNNLRAQHHKIKLTDEFFKDLHWWKSCLNLFNGRAIVPAHIVTNVVAIDACTQASGCFWDGRWQYVNWEKDCPDARNLHINEQEVLSALIAVRQWAPWWSKSMVLFGTDNITTRAAIHKKTSKNPLIMAAVREILAWSILWDFDFDAYHIPGIYNAIPDSISRLHEPNQLVRLGGLLTAANYSPYDVLFPFAAHMSYNAFLVSLYPQIT